MWVSSLLIERLFQHIYFIPRQHQAVLKSNKSNEWPFVVVEFYVCVYACECPKHEPQPHANKFHLIILYIFIGCIRTMRKSNSSCHLDLITQWFMISIRHNQYLKFDRNQKAKLRWTKMYVFWFLARDLRAARYLSARILSNLQSFSNDLRLKIE